MDSGEGMVAKIEIELDEQDIQYIKDNHFMLLCREYEDDDDEDKDFDDYEEVKYYAKVPNIQEW